MTPLVSPRDSSSLLQLLTGEGGGVTIGPPFLPVGLERKRALGEKMRGPLEALNLDRDCLGVGTVGLLASYPGVFISHPEQSEIQGQR